MTLAPRPHPEHGVEELCVSGAELYERALREGNVSATAADGTPCLIDFGLLHPALHDPDRLEPVTPAAALHRLLRTSAARIADERLREDRLVEQFEPFLQLRVDPAVGADTPMLRLLSGTERINLAITEAMAEARSEALCVQPYHGLGGPRGLASQTVAMRRDQALLDRGGRIRTLYHDTLRHLPAVVSYQEQLKGDAQARSLDEITDRMIIFDRTVAFLPANTDRTAAVEVRQPAVVGYLAAFFDRLWHLATPVFPQAVQRPSLNGITPRQQAIAALLVEGHTDAVIADRLGMNIRTARVHIAKLADTLGSESRAQLGYLIGRSGILAQSQEEGEESP
ncbi:helix-turn-helix transcriptional regulator [Streptomyces sp. NK08204]|uniref:helix-turn-helix transcriptional regulator n=1 Tax=Streptomyces sp. NK08204 TaxID=2873260 RepID=UPI001CED367C|nr:helix-turn-helix transcriptional regulator [Streptomyces sp. NK08204]